MWANNLKVGFCFCVSIWLVLMIYKSNASKTVENLLNFFSSKQGGKVFCHPNELLCFLRHVAIHLATYLPIDSSPLLVLSKLTQPPIGRLKQVESMKSFNVSPDINIIFTAPWDISTLASFLRRLEGNDDDSGQKSPPSISSRTVTDQKVESLAIKISL